MLLETRIIALHSAADSLCLAAFKCFWWAPQDFSIFIYFYKIGVSAVQDHPRSINLVPNESAYATSYYSVIVTVVLSCTVSEILQVFFLITPPYSTLILGMFLKAVLSAPKPLNDT